MGYQPRSNAQIVSEINILHFAFNILMSGIVSAAVIVPSVFLAEPYDAAWALAGIVTAFPTIWFGNDCCRNLAFKIATRHIDKETERQKAEIAKNKMIRESEEFISQCRKSK